MSGLRDKIVEIARTSAIIAANQYGAVNGANTSNSLASTGSVQSVGVDTNGNRIATIIDQYGSMTTVYLNSNRPIGPGDNVLLNGNIAQ